MLPLSPWGGFLAQQHSLSRDSERLFGSVDNSTGANNLTCPLPDPVFWVIHIFNECVYNTKEEVGFILGLVSVGCWICASVPQLVENFKRGRADESLSFWFLLLWLLGDSSNLLGCFLTHQFPFQIYTAAYYVSMDLVMIFQFLYYMHKHRKENRSTSNEDSSDVDSEVSSQRSNSQLLCCMCLGVMVPLLLTNFNSPAPIDYVLEKRVGRTLLNSSKAVSMFVWNTESIIGYVIGYLSSALYLGSRIPQIYKNYVRGGTEGISPSMFLLAVCGNSLYGSSILLQDPDPGVTRGEFLIYHCPWLIGSIGTLALDMIVLCQIIYYSRVCRKYRNLPVDQLLNEEDSGSIHDDGDDNFLVV